MGGEQRRAKILGGKGGGEGRVDALQAHRNPPSADAAIIALRNITVTFVTITALIVT